MKLQGTGQSRTWGRGGSRTWTGRGVQRVIGHRNQRDHAARHQAASQDDGDGRLTGGVRGSGRKPMPSRVRGPQVVPPSRAIRGMRTSGETRFGSNGQVRSLFLSCLSSCLTAPGIRVNISPSEYAFERLKSVIRP